MLRRLASILTIFSLVFFSLFFAPSIQAIDPVPTPITTLEQLDESGLNKNLQEFCEKRQGNQMNLETWYSGKCTDDTFSGEGVGFADIVILDLAEKLAGDRDPSQTFTKTLKDIITGLGETSYASPAEQQLAIENAREKLFSQSSTGLVNQAGKVIGLLFQNQPATTHSYLAYITGNLQKHKIIPDTYAAPNGIGFSTFSPFLTIWIAFRNLAYLALVAFFIVYGFMMMFRVNLRQKTVISVQLAIPKLIVTLLIITFSYAIVGLIYDLMFVVIYFIFGYFQSQGIILNTTWESGKDFWNPAQFASGNSWGGLVGSFVLNSLIAGPAAIFGFLNLFLGGIGAAIATGLLGTLNILISIIIIIAVLISYGKLFFKLVEAFISVVVSLVTGPLVLLGNALPGSKVIGTWTRSIVANLSVFPVTMLLLFFSYLLMIQPILGACNGMTSFVDDIYTTLGVPISDAMSHRCEILFGVKNLVPEGSSGLYGVPLIQGNIVDLGFNAQGLLALLGVLLLLMASKYVDIIRDALKVPPFKYGTDIANALKQGITWAPVTPGVGNRIRESGAYDTLTKLSGAKTNDFTQLGGSKSQKSRPSSPISATSTTTEEQSSYDD